MNLKKTVFSVIALVFLISCASTREALKGKEFDCSERLQTVKKRMSQKNHTDAVRILDEIKYQCGGTPLMDSVYYYAGVANFRQKEYIDARIEFERLSREFPRSPFVEEAQYRVAHMIYLQSNPFDRDQTETKEAVYHFSTFLEQFNSGNYADSARHYIRLSKEKLAKKELKTALFYRKQGQHEAALVYFKSLLSQYPDSKYNDEARVYMADVLLKLERAEEAGKIIEEIDGSGFGEELKEEFDSVKARLAGSAE
ncbi:MAG: outer membrane protein assembly factor BamD [Chitinispirillaceae bacterium]